MAPSDPFLPMTSAFEETIERNNLYKGFTMKADPAFMLKDCPAP